MADIPGGAVANNEELSDVDICMQLELIGQGFQGLHLTDCLEARHTKSNQIFNFNLSYMTSILSLPL